MFPALRATKFSGVCQALRLLLLREGQGGSLHLLGGQGAQVWALCTETMVVAG